MRAKYDFKDAVQGSHFKRYREGVEVRTNDEEAGFMEGRLAAKKDTQLTELAGRHLLISQLTEDGLEVALPIRDHGVDLIAYIDIDDQESSFSACAIQLKVTNGGRFELDQKYRKFAEPAAGLRLDSWR